MKVNVYVLFATAMAALLLISAGTKEAKPTVGTHPGDLAPSIEFSGNGNKFEFKNQTGRYTLVNFWAAYDAESRVLDFFGYKRIHFYRNRQGRQADAHEPIPRWIGRKVSVF